MTNDAPNSYDVNQLFCYYSSEYDHLIAIGLYQGFELEQVKDIIQQLFLDFAEKQIDFAEINSPAAYIITSFKRRLIDSHRINVKKNMNAGAIYRELSELAIDKVIEDSEMSAELCRKLKKAFDLLPERCQKVIFFKYYEGLGNEEICVRTGLTIRSIYNNLSEGIRLLRIRIRQHDTRDKIASAMILLILSGHSL